MENNMMKNTLEKLKEEISEELNELSDIMDIVEVNAIGLASDNINEIIDKHIVSSIYKNAFILNVAEIQFVADMINEELEKEPFIIDISGCSYDGYRFLREVEKELYSSFNCEYSEEIFEDILYIANDICKCKEMNVEGKDLTINIFYKEKLGFDYNNKENLIVKEYSCNDCGQPTKTVDDIYYCSKCGSTRVWVKSTTSYSAEFVDKRSF